MVDASMRAGLVFEAHAKAMDFDEAGLPAEEEGDADLSMMPFFSL